MSDQPAGRAIDDVLARLGAAEARLAIGQLVARYALALDARDIDAMVGLFVADVDAGGDWGWAGTPSRPTSPRRAAWPASTGACIWWPGR